MNPVRIRFNFKLYISFNFDLNGTAAIWHIKTGILYDYCVFTRLNNTDYLIRHIVLKCLDSYPSFTFIIG